MPRQCHRSDELLLRGDAASLRQLERHAGRCADCATELEEWNRISAAALSLREQWKSGTLWERIAEGLVAGSPHSQPETAVALPVFDESADREYRMFEQGRRTADAEVVSGESSGLKMRAPRRVPWNQRGLDRGVVLHRPQHDGHLPLGEPIGRLSRDMT